MDFDIPEFHLPDSIGKDSFTTIDACYEVLPEHEALAIRRAATAAHQSRPKAAEMARHEAGYADLGGERSDYWPHDNDPED